MRYNTEIIKSERARTAPDYILYTPTFREYESDNVHLHVVYHKQYDGLIAFWTQSSVEGFGNNHLLLAYSKDDGKTWTKPQYILGVRPDSKPNEKQASWGFPVVSASGRIYLFYFRETDYVDNSRQLTAAFACIVSDDFGKTWSESVDIPMRITPYDNGMIQNNNVCQTPFRLPDGAVLIGMTKWTSYAVCPPNGKWYEDDAHLYFMRLENIDDDPDPKNLKITFLPDDIHGVGIPLGDGIRSCAQEPFTVCLPDGRLFCTLRTALGYAAYTVSADGGHTWSIPKPLRYDDGKELIHPLSPCPIYALPEKGKYLFLYHNRAEDIGGSRNTVYRIVGTFDEKSDQPIVFENGTQSLWMEVPPETGALNIRFDLALYGSVTNKDGKMILWYPERKFFLLGKDIEKNTEKDAK